MTTIRVLSFSSMTLGRSDGSMRDNHPLILLAGTTGYVGGRLLASRETVGNRLRDLARHPESL